MQGVLVVIYQSKKIVNGWVDLNILFELISLVHMMITEENMTVEQIIFSKKHKEAPRAKRIHLQEQLINYLFYITCACVLAIHLFGLLPLYQILSTYTGINFEIGISDKYRHIFCWVLISWQTILLSALVITLIMFFYIGYKNYKNELKLFGKAVLVYCVILLIENGILSDVLYNILGTMNIT